MSSAAEMIRRTKHRHTLPYGGFVNESTCGQCGRSWCFTCDPCPSALCHWCNGRGHSIAPIRLRP